MLDQNLLYGKFQAIVDSSRLGMMKPDVEIYEYAQRQAGVEAQDILFIDDRKINVLAARHFGWQALWLPPSRTRQIWSVLQEKLDL